MVDYIKNCDLKDGEIYVDTKYPSCNIFMWSSKIKNAKYYTSDNRSGFSKNGGGFHDDKNRLATEQERRWLMLMIKLDKYVPYEQFIKTFSKEANYELW